MVANKYLDVKGSGVIAVKQQSDYWIERLELLKRQDKDLDTYTKLADQLGMSIQGLVNVRRGSQELSVEAKLAVLAELNADVTQSDYVRIFPVGIRASMGDKLAEVYDPENGEELDDGFWGRCIDALKRKSGAKSDRALANSLSISTTMISEVRKGRNGLSTVAKIRILDTLGYTASRDLLLNLLPRRIGNRIRDFDNLRFAKRANERGQAIGVRY